MVSSSGVVVCLSVAVLLCGAGVNAQACDPSCKFADRTWGANAFSQLAILPTGLEGVNFDYVGLDGNASWWELCVDTQIDLGNDNFMSILNGFRNLNEAACLACRPSYVYLYQTQLHIFTSEGLAGQVTYVNNSYQPSVTAWDDYCNSGFLEDDPWLPAADAVLEDAQGADVIIAGSPACYSLFSCAYSQTAAPLQASRTCTPNTTETGFPTKEYCSYVYGVSRFNFQIRTGCNGGGCESLKLVHTTTDILSRSRKFRSVGGTSRLGQLRRLSRQGDDLDLEYCLVPDTSFYSD